jgi:hypothetical protein
MISQIIPVSYLETIKARIKEIITNELTNQKTLSTGSAVPAVIKYNQQLLTFFKSTVLNIYCDRFQQLNEDELNGIVINVSKEDDSKGSTAKSQVTTTFTIDVVADALTDVLANETVQRISSSIRHIFLTPLYVRLGFDTGEMFIRSVRVTGRTFYVPESNDANNLTGVSIGLEVQYDEKIIQGVPVVLERNDSTIAQRFSIKTETEVD